MPFVLALFKHSIPGTAQIAPTVSVQIAQQQVTSVEPDGTKNIKEYSVLLNVPVYFPSGGGFTLTFPIAKGDECIVLFNDRNIDDWVTHGAGLPPATGRLHDLSDAALRLWGCDRTFARFQNISATATQLRSDDGSAYVELGPGKIQLVANEVVIHGKTKTTFDAGGTGFVYTPGLIATYTDGVTTTHSAPTPPEVPT